VKIKIGNAGKVILGGGVILVGFLSGILTGKQSFKRQLAREEVIRNGEKVKEVYDGPEI